ncbi:MAG: hypothetical protein H0U09_12980 [Geodermatophilaceae bacterium]|nr:hypothetical protein [Geodermatophilaceae bacterium]
MIARQLIAVGSIVAGVWLLAVAVVYTDFVALAVALVSVLFGVYQLRLPG